jgi:hypothetical protein
MVGKGARTFLEKIKFCTDSDPTRQEHLEQKQTIHFSLQEALYQQPTLDP